MRYAHIIGWGKYAPAKVLSNADLAKMVDTTDEWIRDHTGISRRHVVAEHETCASISAIAAQQALDEAGIGAHQIDLIIVASTTPDNTFPSTACGVQDILGAGQAAAFDLTAACSGFIYALSMATDSIRMGTHTRALVIGAEMLTRVVDWKDRNTCVLFGDGAGAVVLQASDQPGGVLASIMHADGAGGEFLYLDKKTQFVKMNGREVYRFATRVMDKATRDVLQKVGWRPAQVDLVVPHQANLRIIDSAAKGLGIPRERFFTNIHEYGNTSAASIPIALCDAIAAGRLKTNHKAVFVGFGGGLTWGAVAVQWNARKDLPRAERAVNRAGGLLSGLRNRARKVAKRGLGKVFGATDPTLVDRVSKTAEKVKPGERTKN
jgi:3-oxoacyl-[acyl-carrier-protein] synthase-3